MYPASQYKDKQDAENRDKQKDADKIRDKFEKFGFTDCPLGAQGTWREGYIAALIEAKKNDQPLPVTWDFANVFVPASPEEFMNHIKPLVEKKMKELEASDFFKVAPTVEAQPEPEIKAEPDETETATKPKKKAKKKAAEPKEPVQP
jgi:sugar/nucleoside kinase (ribokinase family)